MSEPNLNPLDKLCIELGRVTLAWAEIDTVLDYCSLILRDKYGGHPKWKELSRTRLNQKIQFLRDCVSYNAQLAAVKDAGIDLADEISRLSDERHWLVHGATVFLNKSGLLRQTRNQMKPPESIEERQTSIEDIAAFHRVSLDLSNRLSTFLIERLMRLSQDQIDKLRRELSIGTA